MISEQQAQKNSVLFIGAHPNDIVIGAGGTVARLASDGWDVWLLILTQESSTNKVEARIREAKLAATMLGVQKDNVLTMDFPDTQLQYTEPTINALQEKLTELGIAPDLIVTHTKADSHNDHREAHDITKGIFGEKTILFYPVVNSLVKSDFRPKVFVDISSQITKKIAVLESLGNQKHKRRIKSKETEMESFNKKYRDMTGFKEVEAFELHVQSGSTRSLQLALNLNDSPFHRFWYSLIDDRTLTVMQAVPVHRKRRDWDRPADKDKDREGIDLLHTTFASQWVKQPAVVDYSCDTPKIESIMEEYDILLSGGAVSNTIVRTYFNHFKGIRYVIDYTMPDYEEIHIWDRGAEQKKQKKWAIYRKGEFDSRVLVKDRGILTIMRHPWNYERILIGAMGIHGDGTLGCYKLLTNGRVIDNLIKLIQLPLDSRRGYQVLVEYDVPSGEVELLENSLHEILMP